MISIDQWIADVLAGEAPPEYADATVSEPVRAAFLRTKEAGAWVTLMGPPGCGKTRQAWAVYRHSRTLQLRRYIERHGDGDERREIARSLTRRVRIVPEHEIAAHHFDDAWVTSVCDFAGLVVIDDLGIGRKADDWMVRAVYVIATTRRAYGRACMWSTNIDRERLADYYTPAVASRVLGGVVIESAASDRRQHSSGVTQ